MMDLPLTNYKVVYNEHVLKAVALLNMEFSREVVADPTKPFSIEPESIDVLVIGEDGILLIIQFIPEVKKHYAEAYKNIKSTAGEEKREMKDK